MDWRTILIMTTLCTSTLAASRIKARASQLLTKEQDSQVFGVRATRVAIRMFLMLYVGAIFVVLAFLHVNVRPGVYASLAIGLGLAAWAHVSYFRSLRALNLPAAYLSAIGRARLIMYICFAVIFGIVAFEAR